MSSETSSVNNSATSLALFCKVVDNYGDIGICWRFAKQLEREHDIDVTLWVDDLLSFQRICPAVLTNCNLQSIDGVTVRHWRNQEDTFSPDQVSDIVIEFFACDIPPAYIAAMAQCDPRPVWFNLEGLTAEEWVEGCHMLPSPHPQLPLTKYFFFPGFTQKTGGLLLESHLLEQRQQFQSCPAYKQDFLAQFGVTPIEMQSLTVSLFCYPQAPVAELFDVWIKDEFPVTCLVPQGVAVDAVSAFIGVTQNPQQVGASATQGALTVRVLPFIPQPEYDKLLWSCDLNFVRGEDSFVRAQWAGKPFVWHIYPQDDDLHHVKLNAFLQRFAAPIESLIALSAHWNAAAASPKIKMSELAKQNWTEIWSRFHSDLPQMTKTSSDWQQKMLENGDFSSNLLQFAHSVRQAIA